MIRVLRVALLGLFALGLAGCGSDQPIAGPPATTTTSADPKPTVTTTPSGKKIGGIPGGKGLIE